MLVKWIVGQSSTLKARVETQRLLIGQRYYRPEKFKARVIKVDAVDHRVKDKSARVIKARVIA